MSKPKNVHCIRFYEPSTLGSINCLDYNESLNQLAVLRRAVSKTASVRATSASVIELWNMRNENYPFLEHVLYDNDDSPSLLEAVAWGKNHRLFSCGLDGFLNEHDLMNNTIKRKYSVRSGAAWCMSFDQSKTLVALGTEHGDLVVFDVDEANGDDVNFVKSFPKWSERILCLEWYDQPKNKKIVTGSVSHVAIWDYEGNQCTERIRVGKNNVIVWCLTILKDFTIVTGDSSGATTFWNGSTTTQIKTFKKHKADVLCICKTKNGRIFSSGVDPTIAQFAINSNKEPIEAQPLNVHHHDVRSLLMINSGWLLSGGIDTQLVKSFPNPKNICTFSQNFVNNIAVSENMIGFRNSHSIDLWELSSDKSANARKLATIDSKKIIIAMGFSNSWVAYSTFKKLNVINRSSTKLVKVEVISEPLVGVISQIEISRDKILCASTGTIVYIFDMEATGIFLKEKLKFRNKHIFKILLSDEHLVVAFSDCTIEMINTSNWKTENTIQLGSLPSALAINPFTPNELWIGLTNQNVLRHDMKTKDSAACYLARVDDAYRGICFSNDRVIVYTDRKFISIEPVGTGKVVSENTSYQNLIKMGNLMGKGFDLYLVEVTPEALFFKLPPTLSKKRFAS